MPSPDTARILSVVDAPSDDVARDAPKYCEPCGEAPCQSWCEYPDYCAGCRQDPCDGSCASSSFCRFCDADPCYGNHERCEPTARAKYLADQETARLAREAEEQRKDYEAYKTARKLRDAEIEQERVEKQLARLRPRPRSAVIPDRIPSLGELLSVADDPQPYLIDRLWLKNDSVLFGAAPKVGKTKRRNEVIKRLVDGGLLFGEFAVTPLAEGETVVILDFELSEELGKKWLRSMGIQNEDRVHVIHLKGRVPSFDIRKPEVRAQWAALFRSLGCRVLILDCLAPVMTGLGINENTGAGEFLDAWKTLIVDAGVSENMVIHHFGKGGDDFRGWSGIEADFAGLWKLTLTKKGDLRSARRFEAGGRDTDVPKGLLSFDPETGLSEYRRTAGKDATGSLDASEEAAVDGPPAGVTETMLGGLRAFVKANRGCTKRQAKDAVKGRASTKGAALDYLIEAGEFRLEEDGQADRLYPVREAA